MKVIIGADHRGFEKKEVVKAWLGDNGYEVVDVGASEYFSDDDYADYAVKVAEGIDESDRGILFCGSGHGMDMAANRYKNVRAILGFNKEVIKQGREHEDANVLVIASDWISEEELINRVKLFLEIDFSGEERHIRRLKKLREI